jgi:hypothetical protein
VRDQLSHPYKTAGRIIVLYILTFTFLDSTRDDRRLWTEFSLLLISSWIQFWSFQYILFEHLINIGWLKISRTDQFNFNHIFKLFPSTYLRLSLIQQVLRD